MVPKNNERRGGRGRELQSMDSPTHPPPPRASPFPLHLAQGPQQWIVDVKKKMGHLFDRPTRRTWAKILQWFKPYPSNCNFVYTYFSLKCINTWWIHREQSQGPQTGEHDTMFTLNWEASWAILSWRFHCLVRLLVKRPAPMPVFLKLELFGDCLCKTKTKKHELPNFSLSSLWCVILDSLRRNPLRNRVTGVLNGQKSCTTILGISHSFFMHFLKA